MQSNLTNKPSRDLGNGNSGQAYLNLPILWILHHHKLSNYNKASMTHTQRYQAKSVVKPVSPAHNV